MSVTHLKNNHVVESAGSLMERDVLVVSGSMRAGALCRMILTRSYSCTDLIIVVDEFGNYVGVVEPFQMATASKAELISSLTTASWPAVPPSMDQEHAVEVAKSEGVSVLVVVEASKPVGLLSGATLLRILAQEHREDVDRMVGIMKERSGARHSLEDAPIHRFAQRLPWLLVGLVLSTVMTAVMVKFEQTLEANVAMASFIPALVYLADAVGTQTETVAVRGLKFRTRSIIFILGSEALTGALIGTALGLLAFVAVWLMFDNAALAAGVGLALMVAATIASVVGLALPLILERSGIDPAFGSGPIATIIQDVLTIIIYFYIMTTLLEL